jgi:hypothetical protein
MVHRLSYNYTMALADGYQSLNTHRTFYFPFTSQESFLEDINNILNSGEVPNLLGNDDMEAIGAAMRPLMMTAGLPVTKQGIYAYFVNRSGVHICFGSTVSTPFLLPARKPSQLEDSETCTVGDADAV